MDKRKQTILNTIIKEHIKTGMPVGSGVIVEKYKLDISPATARNEMADLEELGYIIQPHTSAGRVPTEKAYKFYLENSVLGRENGCRKKIKIDMGGLGKVLEEKNEKTFKESAKLISEFTGNAVFWAFHRNNLYYTGISKLFSQPEFSHMEMVHDISAIIDHIDEIIDKIFEKINYGVNVLIGRENPFGDLCSTILVKYKHEDRIGVFGILGPMRMNYEKNLALVEFINNKLSKK